VKTTFDLPDALVRRAKALAATQGRPLRDLVAEAIDEKLVDSGEPEPGRPGSPGREAWERWKARLESLPDGSAFNPEGIDDEAFFRSLAEVRAEPWGSRDPFATTD
jgi:hypothetical protein